MLADPAPDRHRVADRSRWSWLLIIPIVLPLIPALYNADRPSLWGIPRFYWLQLAFVAVGVSVTSLVYLKTRPPRTPEPKEPPAPEPKEPPAAAEAGS